jgi:hypothetical protein
MHFVYGIIGIVLSSKTIKKQINSDHNNFVFLTFGLTYLNCKIGYANIKLKICSPPVNKKSNIYSHLVFT